MKIKLCLHCNRLLPVEMFYKYNKSKDGLRCNCKGCYLLYDKDYKAKRSDKNKVYWTKRRQLRKHHLYFFIQRMYTGMNERVSGASFEDRSYFGKEICSRKEFTYFSMRNWKLKELFVNWINSGHNHFLVPTPDRIDNKKGYSLNNIQFLTWLENTTKK